MEHKNKQNLDVARERVVSIASKYHIPLDIKEPADHHASAQFIHRTGLPDIIIGKEGLACDIIVIAHNINDVKILYDKNIIAALFDTGRPVLLIPPMNGEAKYEWRDEVVSIAWDGGMESARAIFNAMPILERAEKIYLLTALGHGKEKNLDLHNPIMEYLHAHGLEANHILIDCNGHNSAETALNKARELKSDLMVMGAYGHSRFREIIMGGFTNHMLEKADIPLLLSH